MGTHYKEVKLLILLHWESQAATEMQGTVKGPLSLMDKYEQVLGAAQPIKGKGITQTR